MTTDENEKGYIWDEAISNAFEEAGVDIGILDVITREQWSHISRGLNEHAEVAPEFFAPHPSSYDLFEMNEEPKRRADAERIAHLEKQLGIYEKDVKRVHGGQSNHADVEQGRVVIYDR